MNEDESSLQEVDNNDVNGNNLLQKSADKAKNELSKNLKNKAGKQAALKGKMAAAMGPVIFWGVVIIVAIIIIIGIIMFFVTMPGMVMEKIKSLFKEMGNYIATFFGADTTEQMSDTQIFETLDYLEEMGYDVKGFGFLTDYYTQDDKNEIEEALSDEEKKNYKVDEKTGVVRDSADKIILAKSDFIFTYITSDNYIYTLKNNNVTKSTHLPGVLGHLESIFNGFTVAAGKVIRFLTPAKLRNFLFDPLEKFIGVELDDREIWGKGLIALRDDSGNLAEFDTLFNWDTVKIDVKKKKLSIRRRSLFNNNNPIEYSLDGWTGRYGMPIEFLLSVHVATMMPDLAYDMSTAFPTNVNITLHDATGEVVAAYKTKAGQYITYEELNKYLTGGSGRDLFSKVLSWFDNLVQTDKEVQIASKLGIDHAENCECVYELVEGYTLKLNPNVVVYKRDNGEYYYKTNVNGEYTEVTVDPANIKVTTEQNYTTICEQCKRRLYDVITQLRAANDYNFKFYIPYITSVTNHWFRDVSFMTNDAGASFVDMDYDYEARMRERWTLYKTYSSSDSSDYAKKNIGNFKLYVLSSDGNYAVEETEDMKKSNKVVKDQDTGFYIFEGTTEEAKNYNLTLAKKAETIGTVQLDDLNWNKISGNKWSAYKFDDGDGNSSYERVYPDDELEDDSTKDVKERIYVKIESKDNVKQTGEGQRLETNATIKRMFLNNWYFKYDGTLDRAEMITRLRKESNIPYGALTDEDLNRAIVVGEKEYTAKDLAGQVTINQDSLNAFSMLENTHTLDADYIYRDFKELVVELGYFTKEELTDETPRLLQWIVPDTGSGGFPNRIVDKRENEYGTMIHSEGDIDESLKETISEELMEFKDMLEDGDSQTEPENDPEEPTLKEIEQDNLSHEVGKSVVADIKDSSKELGAAADVKYTDGGGTSKAASLGDGELQKVESPETIDSDLEYIPAEKPTTSNKPTAASSNSSNENYSSRYAGGSKTYTIDESVHGDGYSYGVELRGVTYKKYRQGIGSGSYWNKPYGSHNYASSGCGPISSAILASGYGVEEGPTYYGNLYHGSPPSFSGIKKALATVGIEGESYTISHSDSTEMTSSALALAKRMQEALEEGKPVIVLVGHSSKVGEAYQYTSKGHYFVFIGIDDDGTPIYCNTTSDTHEYTHRGSFRRENPIEEFVFYYMQNSGSSNRGIFIPNEPPSGIKKDDPYTGYKGNEGVVSPVTGVLLEYGTYNNSDKDTITDEQYRVNVDLKYGPIASIITESADEEKTEFKSQIVSDKVGYAKILVLDNENYQKVEQALVGKTSSEFKRELDGELGGSFLAEDGKYQDFSSLADKDRRKVLETINKKWNDYDKTLYGYKEFAELYDKYGISGYIIFIDGFVCELPDENLKGDKKIAEKLPEGEELTIDSFKAVTPGNLDLSKKKEQLATSYKADTKYKLASQKATTKLYAETKIKTLASTSMYTDDIILLKEGTIIGRTMTDAELLKNDDIRDRSEYNVTYEKARPSDITQKGEIIGNYIRIIMRDLDGTPVENVEDYMKLANKGGIQISDDYDVSDPDYFVTLDQFLIMFANYPNIIANAEAFIEMQDKYQVNAVFAAAVTITESGGGTGWDLIDPSTYNWFSIKGNHGGGYIDRNGTSWNRYSSFAEAVDSFGNLIANSSHYYKADKYWVSQIGPTYCSESWVKSTIKHMNEAYEKIL